MKTAIAVVLTALAVGGYAMASGSLISGGSGSSSAAGSGVYESPIYNDGGITAMSPASAQTAGYLTRSGGDLGVDAGFFAPKLTVYGLSGATGIQGVTGQEWCPGTAGVGCVRYDGTGLSVKSGIVTGDSTVPRLRLLNSTGAALIYSNTSIQIDSSTINTVCGQADSSTATCGSHLTNSGWVTPGSRLFRWVNNGVEKAHLDKDGQLSTATGHPVGLAGMSSKQMGTYSVATNADVLFNARGLPTPSVAGTASAAPAPTGGTRPYIQHASVGVSGNAAGITGPYTTTRALYRPRLSTIMVTDSAVNLRRVWVGLTEASLTSVVVPTGSVADTTDFVAIAFDTAITANFRCVSGDGTNMSSDDIGVAPAASTEYRLVVDWTTSGTLRCCVNSTCVNKTTLLSAAAVDMGIHNAATTLQAAAANHLISVVASERN